MTYRDAIEALNVTRICMGGCGLSDHAHRGSIFLDIIHWSERRVTRRGLRKLLLLRAKRDRMLDPGFLNGPGFWYIHLYLDERKANEWAAQVGVRFPIAYSAPERRSVALIPGLSRRMPAVYAWANRA